MKLCRFLNQDLQPCVGLTFDEKYILDLTAAGITSLSSLLEMDDVVRHLNSLLSHTVQRYSATNVRLLPPVDGQEVWAAGVTYLRSKKARMDESEFSASAYDKVYEAPRPEIFFKSLAEKVVGPGDKVGIRKDAKWSVPEPELALVINSRGRIAGFTICNDMSSRDIEGENLLYLPQAKIYDRSCALGPYIRVGSTEAEVRDWTLQIRIERAGETVFIGETALSQIKRTFQELVDYLLRSQLFPNGVILSTGTGIIPPDDFTLAEDDRISIRMSGVGSLENTVVVV